MPARSGTQLTTSFAQGRPSQAEPDGETQGNAACQTVREERENGVEEGAQDGADGEDAARGVAVGESGDGETQGAQNEAELDGVGQACRWPPGDAPGPHQVVRRAVGRKPQRGTEQLGEDDDGNRPRMAP